MKIFKKLSTSLFIALTLFSCSDDTKYVSKGDYENGFFVTNEGTFGQDNAEITFISNDFQTVKQDVFKSENNGAILGDVLQSMALYENKAFLIVNNSNKIEVVNRFTFKRIATINTQLDNPRYIAFSNGKGYVTNWGAGSNPDDDFVAVINLTTYTVESTIAVVEGPEKIKAHNGKLYVAHQGGWNFNNKISVINPSNNTVSNVIEVGDVPRQLEVINNQLFVMSSGRASWHAGGATNGAFHKVDLSNLNVNLWHTFTDSKPSYMAINGSNLFYTQGKVVYKVNPNTSTFSSQALIDATDQNMMIPYGFIVSNNNIFFLDAVSYSGNSGKINIYNMNGVFLQTKEAGYLPNGLIFN